MNQRIFGNKFIKHYSILFPFDNMNIEILRASSLIKLVCYEQILYINPSTKMIE